MPEVEGGEGGGGVSLPGVSRLAALGVCCACACSLAGGVEAGL